MAECAHASVRAWVYAEGDQEGESAGLWSCRECGHKFVPIAQLLEAQSKLEKYRSILTGILERQSCAIEGGWELCEMCGYSVDNPPTDEDRADCLEIQIREALSDE